MMELQTPQLNTLGDDFSHREHHAHRHDIAEKLVGSAASLLLTVLAARFVLHLLGANPANGFAQFIYGFSAPFVAPFYNLFSYDHPSLGIAMFEGYTLVAMAVYGLVAAGLAKVIAITRFA